MSLILEALRKSEAERRRGQVPGLHAELPPAAQPTRVRRAPWPWLLAVAIIAIGASAWLLRGGWAPTPSADDPSLTSTESVRPVVVDRPVADADTADTAPPTVAEPPPPTTDAADTDAAPRRAREPGASTASERDPNRTRPPAPIVAESPAVAGAPPPAAVPTTPAIDAVADDNATTALDGAAPLRLSDLATAERRALPTLQVSMHMWAPTSARRFAIIDGARVNEGDRLGEAVVDEITRDGVVLAWQGRRVHIPIH